MGRRIAQKRDDIPLCIIEGLAMYGERRRLTGRSEPGQINLRRLEELAHIQRRTKWINVTDLLANDGAWSRDSTVAMSANSNVVTVTITGAK